MINFKNFVYNKKENIILVLTNKRKKKKTKTEQKIKKETEDTLNKEITDDIKKLHNLQNDLESIREEKIEQTVLTPRSKEKSETIRRKLNFLRRACSSYEYKRK